MHARGEFDVRVLHLWIMFPIGGLRIDTLNYMHALLHQEKLLLLINIINTPLIEWLIFNSNAFYFDRWVVMWNIHKKLGIYLMGHNTITNKTCNLIFPDAIS